MISLFLNHVGEKRGEKENDEQELFHFLYIYKSSHNIGVHEIMKC